MLEFFGGGTFKFYFWSGNLNGNLLSSNSAVKANVWTHLAVTVKGTSVVFYINGVVDSTFTLSNIIIGGTTNANRFGTNTNWEGIAPLNGILDEIKFFDGPLSAGAVTADFNSFPMYTTIAPIDSGPKLLYYWPIAGNTSEIINGRDMTNLVGATLVNDRLNYVKSAIQFDGSSTASATVPAGQYFNNDFSFSLWFYSSTHKPYTRLFDFYQSSSLGYLLEFFGLSCFKFYFWSNNMNANLLSSNTAVKSNVWTHLAVTVKGTSVVFYINGVVDSTFTLSKVNIGGSTNANRFGTNTHWEAIAPMNGILDEIKFFDGPLSAVGVTADFNQIPLNPWLFME